MQTTHILAEVLQRRHAAWQFLYLIKEKQGLAWNNLLQRISLQTNKNAVDVKINSKKLFYRVIVLAVDIYHVFKLILAKFLQNISLSHLSRAFKN